MIKPNGIKILVKVNRTLQTREVEGFDRKISGNYDALLNKVSIDRTQITHLFRFPSGTTNDSIFTQISYANQVEEQNIIFTLINGTKENNIFFHSEAISTANNLQGQKGIVNTLAESIINETFGAKIWAKILEFPTFSNIAETFGAIDEEGFFQTHSISTLKDLFSFVFQNYSEKSMMIILKGTMNKFNLLYYPTEAHHLVSQLCNNFYSQKFVIGNYFKLIKPPKFCFFWNIVQSAIPQAVQLIMILQSGKGDKTVIESAKRQMQRLQLTYKRLNEKYRKILNILNKCIDLENAQIDKKSLLYIDCLPSSQKPSDKLKISAIRKSQNDEQIQQLQKDVAQLQNEITLIKQAHRDKMVQHQNVLTLKQGQKEKLWKLYQSYINPKVKIDHTNNNNLYWKPISIKAERQSEQIQESFNQPSLTKQNLNSHKNITKKNIQVKNQNNEKRNIQFAMYVQQDAFDYLKDKKAQQIKQQQIKLQIQSLFKIIGAQQKTIERNFQQSRHILKNSTINQIKNRQNQLQVNPAIIRQCFSRDFSKQKYDNWIKQQKYFQRFQKELKQRQMATQTLTTIRDI